MTRYWRNAGLVAVLAILCTIWTLWENSTASTAHIPSLAGIAPEYRATLAAHAHNNTIVLVPVNSGMLHLARNLLCSLQRTTFDTSGIVFWALDEGAEKTLAGEGYATYRDASLFSVSTNQNRKGATAAYRRMMKERPKFFINILAAGYDILMLDADTVFWQSPLLLVPPREEQVDAVFSTDSRKFYQTHDAFRDERRRGSRMPPVCNGIFWMRSSEKTVALWMDMLDVFFAPPPLGWIRRINFQDDQRGMDVLLNDGRAELVGPFPNGITEEMLPRKAREGSDLKIRLLDQTLVANGVLLQNSSSTYEENLARLRGRGQERIAAHFNWDTRIVSKEQGAREKRMYFLNDNGTCNPVVR